MKNKHERIHRYCCVASLALEIGSSKECFIHLMSMLWDKKHKTKNRGKK